MTGNRCRVLFLAEGATLAHVARPLLLAENLDPTRFDVVLARPGTFGWLTADAAFAVVELDCQGSDTFSRRLDHGQPIYDLATLERYVQADLALIDDLKPDVVVGDFRLSLSVSARLRRGRGAHAAHPAVRRRRGGEGWTRGNSRVCFFKAPTTQELFK